MAESGPVRCVVLGAGLRGSQVYGRHALAHPERLRVVALAEPHPRSAAPPWPASTAWPEARSSATGGSSWRGRPGRSW